MQVPVYIGRAKNVGGRKAEHAKALDLRSEDPLGKGGKDHMAKKLVSYDDNPTNWRIEILGYSNDIIYTLERLFIEQYKPFLNDRDTIPTKEEWEEWYEDLAIVKTPSKFNNVLVRNNSLKEQDWLDWWYGEK